MPLRGCNANKRVSRSHRALAGRLPSSIHAFIVCLCLSLFVFVCLCLSLFVFVCLCLSLFVFVCLRSSLLVLVCPGFFGESETEIPPILRPSGILTVGWLSCKCGYFEHCVKCCVPFFSFFFVGVGTRIRFVPRITFNMDYVRHGLSKALLFPPSSPLSPLSSGCGLRPREGPSGSASNIEALSEEAGLCIRIRCPDGSGCPQSRTHFH